MNFICQTAGLWCGSSLDIDFLSHMAAYGLSYGTDAEYQFRLQQFTSADAEIQRINADPSNTFKVAHNKFSTMTNYEKERFLNGKFMEGGEEVQLSEDNLQASVDWRTKGAIGPV